MADRHLRPTSGADCSSYPCLKPNLQNSRSDLNISFGNMSSTEPIIASYGTWESPITTSVLTSDSVSVHGVRVNVNSTRLMIRRVAESVQRKRLEKSTSSSRARLRLADVSFKSMVTLSGTSYQSLTARPLESLNMGEAK